VKLTTPSTSEVKDVCSYTATPTYHQKRKGDQLSPINIYVDNSDANSPCLNTYDQKNWADIPQNIKLLWPAGPYNDIAPVQ
jgi:hypothetical protein